MSRIIIFLAVLVAAQLVAGALLASPPVVSNVQVQQRENSPLVDILFDLADDGNDPIRIIPMLSLDGGATWPVRCDSLSGDLFTPAGSGKSIVWDSRGNFGILSAENCRIRLFACDTPVGPSVEFFRLEGGAPVSLGGAARDTVGFGQPYGLQWQGATSLLDGLDAQVVAEMDTIAPLDDGILGYKWRYLGDGCDPMLSDCWHPRYFDEASGDSISYWGANQTLGFANDGWGFGVFQELLASGVYAFEVDAIDIIQDTVPGYGRRFELVVNFDPETYLLNGETDFAHPEDSEVYPYYVLLNDPGQVHHPFAAGDRIPDRSYAVFKGLFRDDVRDVVLDESYAMRGTGSFTGVRENLTGGLYSFQSSSSGISEPATWPAGMDGWAADTLGFLVGPRTDYTFRMQAVDEHGRRDGTPATLDFSVGYPPCVQCVELLAGGDGTSAHGPDLDCFAGQDDHPCFSGEMPEFLIPCSGVVPVPGQEYLDPTGTTYMGIHRQTLNVIYSDEPPGEEEYIVFDCNKYPVSILVHARDDLREAWENPLYRMLGMRYQVDHACDPNNQIQDGSRDNLNLMTWGVEEGDDLLDIDPATGLWRIRMEVALPHTLINLGLDTFRLIVQFQYADGDQEFAAAIVDRILRPLGEGQVRVSALDQTRCDVPPFRPARYHLFDDVRPSVADPAPGTWRDCAPLYPVYESLDLCRAAMQSHEPGEEAMRSFRISLVDNDGSLVTCEP